MVSPHLVADPITEPHAKRERRKDARPGELLAAALDLFDRVQLEAVIGVCGRSQSLSEAGRELFAESRKAKAQPNDADRLRKYLARFGLSWADVAAET